MEVERQCNNENSQNEHTNHVQPEAFLNKAYDLVNKAAETGVGQFAIEKIDKVLSALEKTAKWSLPHTEKTDKSNTPVDLERPLPWIPFLATIVALRAVRLSVSFASILIGNDTISPSDLVYFLQTRRRKLRAIKYNGLRAIRLKKQSNIDRERRGVVGRLASLFGAVVCRVGYRSASPARVAIKERKSSNKNQPKSVLNADKGPQNKISQQNQHTNDSDDDLTCEQLLEKYVKLTDDEDEFNLNMEGSSQSSSSDEMDDVDTSELKKELIELNRKREEDEIEKSKVIIEKIIMQRKEQMENEITNKLESQIAERIEKHTQALKAKLDEKIEEIQGAHENAVIDNPTSVSINPAKLSPKIAHNGSADDSKTDKVEKPNVDVVSYKGKETFLIDEISIKLKLRNENGCGSEKRLMSPGSSSEDLFYSPIGSPEPERHLGNHSPVKNIIKQREALDSIESTASFIEDELKTQLQVHLKQANSNKKPTSISTYKGNRGKNA